jgi:WhiB family transcriptional regulator, redox-sensing transcriptional regulator
MEAIPEQTILPMGTPCRGKTHIYFGPEGERPQARVKREAAARKMCGGCAVRESCIQYGLENAIDGIWGGESEEDRIALGYRVSTYAEIKAKRNKSKPASDQL